MIKANVAKICIVTCSGGKMKPKHILLLMIVLTGRNSTFVDLDTGFDPEFSARDNVYMNEAIFGYSPAC